MGHTDQILRDILSAMGVYKLFGKLFGGLPGYPTIAINGVTKGQNIMQHVENNTSKKNN